VPTTLGLTLEVFLAGRGSFTAGKITPSFLLNRSLLNCRLNNNKKELIEKKYLLLDLFFS